MATAKVASGLALPPCGEKSISLVVSESVSLSKPKIEMFFYLRRWGISLNPALEQKGNGCYHEKKVWQIGVPLQRLLSPSLS